ncbi:MAG: dihydropteroate synthase, partial [Candidatus Cloacimonetes bacterium]|nr:dihydropteroate synthase [Candidatus Cloacimonadota bacterium]
ADIIDIGGESTRPGANPLSIDDELKRVIPVITALRSSTDACISIDTYKSTVARAALEKDADMINDISGLTFDPEMVQVASEFNVPVVIMHIKGTPLNMQTNPTYGDLMAELVDYFTKRIDFALAGGVKPENIILDPGIGFGKRFKDNLLILKKLAEFKALRVPLLLGASRKSFINNIYQSSPQEREEATLATTAIAHQHNVEIVRVHAVKQNKRLLQTLTAVKEII